MAYYILLTDMGKKALGELLPTIPIRFDIVVTSNRHIDVDTPVVIDGILTVRPAQDGSSLNHVVLRHGTPPEYSTTPLPEKAGKDPTTKGWTDNCLGRK